MSSDKKLLEVYHAGTEIITGPNCSIGRPNLDFGQGFYITDIYDQAVNFARQRAISRKKSPIINVYHLDREAILDQARCKIFDNYDEEWLDFIINNRRGTAGQNLYDYVEGGVANDRVINTINLYLQGILSKDATLRNLKYLKPNNQICLLTQEITNSFLVFKDYISLPDYELL